MSKKERAQLQAQQNPCPADHPVFLWPLGDGQGGIMTKTAYVESPADLCAISYPAPRADSRLQAAGCRLQTVRPAATRTLVLQKVHSMARD